MALTDNTTNYNAGQTQPKTNNLLDFINGASSSIQEALVSKKKRPVNVKKYIQKRVKRLNDKGTKPSISTKNKPVQKSSKQDSTKQLRSVGSRSWPLLAPPREFPQTQALPTTSYSTMFSPPSYICNDVEYSLYPAPPSNSKSYDPELESLLSELVGPEPASQPSTRHSSVSFQTGVSPSYTPQSMLESQVHLGEHPYSPPRSDCSDDAFNDDSAYSSPIGSVEYRSVTPPLAASDWPIQSSAPAPTIQYPVPVTSTVWFEQPTVSGAGWLPQFSSITQGPPMTPTVSELLLDRAPF